MMYDVNIEIAREMLETMPASKKETLKKACERNMILTSYFGLEELEFTTYKEGWLLELYGCRAKFSVWAKDNDGEFVFQRKPNESRLNKLYTQGCKTDRVVDLGAFFFGK